MEAYKAEFYSSRVHTQTEHGTVWYQVFICMECGLKRYTKDESIKGWIISEPMLLSFLSSHSFCCVDHMLAWFQRNKDKPNLWQLRRHESGADTEQVSPA